MTNETEVLKKSLEYIFSNKNDIPKNLLEDSFFYGFVWHFNEKKRWSDEQIKKHAIETEINKLDRILGGEADTKTINFYINQFEQYLQYQLTENKQLRDEFLKLSKAGMINKNRALKLSIIKEAIKLLLFHSSAESYFKKQSERANDLTKQEYKNVGKKFNNIVSGYSEKNDNSVQHIFKALLRFRDYLKDYNKPENKINDSRFESQLSKDEIKEYFQVLLNINEVDSRYQGKQVLQEEELKNFLHSSFRNFDPVETKFPVKANCSNASLIWLFHEFYLKEEKIDSVSATVFHKMLKENFINFKNTELKTIRKEFSRVRPVKYPFE